jgi:hypothetical protein
MSHPPRPGRPLLEGDTPEDVVRAYARWRAIPTGPGPSAPPWAAASCGRRPPGCPPGLQLFLLEEGDLRALAADVSCGQDIAGDGAFSLGMIAD